MPDSGHLGAGCGCVFSFCLYTPARDCGAAKLSRYFAAILSEDCSLPDHRNDPEIASIYDEKLRLYDEEAKK